MQFESQTPLSSHLLPFELAPVYMYQPLAAHNLSNQVGKQQSKRVAPSATAFGLPPCPAPGQRNQWVPLCPGL